MVFLKNLEAKRLLVEHMKQTYGLIVVHPELDAACKSIRQSPYPAFGKPQKYKELLYWILEESTAPLVDDSTQSSSSESEPTSPNAAPLSKN